MPFIILAGSRPGPQKIWRQGCIWVNSRSTDTPFDDAGEHGYWLFLKFQPSNVYGWPCLKGNMLFRVLNSLVPEAFTDWFKLLHQSWGGTRFYRLLKQNIYSNYMVIFAFLVPIKIYLWSSKDCLTKRVFLLFEGGQPCVHRLDQDVALGRGPHLFHITTLGNPCFLYSHALQDRKTIEREIKKCSIRRNVCSGLYTGHFCHVGPSCADWWLSQPTYMQPTGHLNHMSIYRLGLSAETMHAWKSLRAKMRKLVSISYLQMWEFSAFALSQLFKSCKLITCFSKKWSVNESIMKLTHSRLISSDAAY